MHMIESCKKTPQASMQRLQTDPIQFAQLESILQSYSSVSSH